MGVIRGKICGEGGLVGWNGWSRCSGMGGKAELWRTGLDAIDIVDER